MKLEEGMYVRTKYGIAKYIHRLVRKETIYYVIDKKIVYDNAEDWEDILSSNEILKASYNIIDLIEEGDYVNGERVTQVTNEYIEVCYGRDSDEFIKEKDIKSIVTKEQFESMQYKVGE